MSKTMDFALEKYQFSEDPGPKTDATRELGQMYRQIHKTSTKNVKKLKNDIQKVSKYAFTFTHVYI